LRNHAAKYFLQVGALLPECKRLSILRKQRKILRSAIDTSDQFIDRLQLIGRPLSLFKPLAKERGIEFETI